MRVMIMAESGRIREGLQAILDSFLLQTAGGKLMLSGVDDGLINTLEKAEAVGRLGAENILRAERRLFSSTEKALEADKSWIEDPTQRN